jgi:hypothetical protein
MFDVLDIEAELINAKIDLVNARYDKMISQYRVLSGMGNLVHTLGLQWPVESKLAEDVQVQPQMMNEGKAPVTSTVPEDDKWYANTTGTINWDVPNKQEK